MGKKDKNESVSDTPFAGITLIARVEHIDPNEEYLLIKFGEGVLRCKPANESQLAAGEPKVGDFVAAYGFMKIDDDGAFLEAIAIQRVSEDLIPSL